MPKFIDLTGQKFGRLTVIEVAEKSKKGSYIWKCQCDCDNNKIVEIDGCNLRNGKTKSCGCLKGGLIDLTGKKFGRLTVIKRLKNNKNGNLVWLCMCDCDNKTIETTGVCLRSGESQSCGCLKKELAKERATKHGLWKSPLYGVHNSIYQRCYNPNNHQNYKYYGARGIKVCDDWIEKDGFINFYNWSIENGYQEGLTIERLDVNSNYEPDNCKWVTMKEQANNKRNNHLLTIKGETRTVSEWAELIGIRDITLRSRIKSGWSEEQLLIPVRSKKNNGNK